VIRRELLAGVVLRSHSRFHRRDENSSLAHAARTYGEHYLVIALTIGCSLIGVVMFARSRARCCRLFCVLCGLDPASASAPFVCHARGRTGLIIYSAWQASSCVAFALAKDPVCDRRRPAASTIAPKWEIAKRNQNSKSTRTSEILHCTP